MAGIIEEWKNALPKITDPIALDKKKQIVIWVCVTVLAIIILFIVKQQLNKKK